MRQPDLVFTRAGPALALAVFLGCRLSVAAPLVNVPEECGSQNEFERETFKRLPEGVVLPQTSVTITQNSSGYFLQMQVGTEQRELFDADCRALFHAAVVVSAALAESATRSASKPSAPPEEPEKPVAASSAKSATSSVRLSVGLGFGLNVGLLPRAAPVGEFETRLIWRKIGVLAALRYLPPSSEQDDRDRGVEVSAWGAQLALAYEPTSTWQLRLGAEGYRESGVGLGSPAKMSDVAWALGPTAGLMFIPVRRGDFWFGAALDLHLELLRPRFEIREYGEVFRASQFAAAGYLRVGHVFF